jgi:hypothetical protein
MINLWNEFRRSLQTGLKYILLILLFGTSQCQKIDPGETVSIPDPNFLNELFNEGVDSNGDGQISTHEAESIRALSLGPSGISDLTGIEAFVNLDTLVVEVNPLLPPDLSGNTALRYLALRGCGLTHLDISKNSALKHLDCTGNEGLDSFLEMLDLSGNPDLETLFLLGNELMALDVDHNPNLQKIECSRNRIPELDLSANLLLGELKCKNNLLKSLDLSVNTALVVMACCGNQLSSINLSQNTKLIAIGIDNMASLQEVCVWTKPFPPEGIKVLLGFSPNAFFTTKCSN